MIDSMTLRDERLFLDDIRTYAICHGPLVLPEHSK